MYKYIRIYTYIQGGISPHAIESKLLIPPQKVYTVNSDINIRNFKFY